MFYLSSFPLLLLLCIFCSLFYKVLSIKYLFSTGKKKIFQKKGFEWPCLDFISVFKFDTNQCQCVLTITCFFRSRAESILDFFSTLFTRWILIKRRKRLWWKAKGTFSLVSHSYESRLQSKGWKIARNFSIFFSFSYLNVTSLHATRHFSKILYCYVFFHFHFLYIFLYFLFLFITMIRKEREREGKRETVEMYTGNGR